MIIDIHSEEDLKREILEKQGFVFLQMGASWCRPCQVMKPAFEAVEERFEGKVRLCRLDVDEQGEMASRFELAGTPTFLFFKDGKEVGRIIGYRQKNKFFEDIEKFMNQ